MFQTDSLLPAIDPVDSYFIFISHTEDQAVVSTEGMRSHDLPELVIAGVRPSFLAGQAADLLKRVADYMLTTTAELQPGQTVVIDPDTIVRFAEPANEIPPEAECTYWVLEEVPLVCCPECDGGDHQLSPPIWQQGLPN
jgi:hypothetical protein